MIDVVFDDSPLEQLLHTLKPGEAVCASHLLTALDGESEEALDAFFDRLFAVTKTISLEDMPRYADHSQTAARLRTEAQLVKQGDLLKGLEAGDPLRLYLEELAGVPVCGDPCLLAEELAQANAAGKETEQLCDRLMKLSLSRVVELACRYAGYGVLLMDLIQEGSMGLWLALLSLDKETDFEAYRDMHIRWHMAKAVIAQAHAAGVGQKLRQALEDYRAVDEKLLAELGRNPTHEEMAQALHLSMQETATVAQMLESARLMQKTKQPEPEQLPQEEDQAVEDTAYFQMRQRIQELLSVLPDQDAKLLTLRYGLEGGLPMDAIKTSQALGITPEEVNRREAAALARLRAEK